MQLEIQLLEKGVNLPDTSLQRLVWEQARWELLEIQQSAEILGQVSLPAPEAQKDWKLLLWTGISLFALLSAFLIWQMVQIRGQIPPQPTDKRSWLPEVSELHLRLQKAQTPSQLSEALFDLRYQEFNERMFKLRREEWLLKTRRDRELIFMLIEQWGNAEICLRLKISENHLYRLRSNLRSGLDLTSDDQLIPALRAWASE